MKSHLTDRSPGVHVDTPRWSPPSSASILAPRLDFCVYARHCWALRLSRKKGRVYELNKIDLLKDVFIWAYERSAARNAAVRQSLGEPNPFRLRYRDQLRVLIADLIRGGVDRGDAVAPIAGWAGKEIDPDDRQHFIEIVEAELTSLHEGNFARYRIRPSEFAAWRQVWETR